MTRKKKEDPPLTLRVHPDLLVDLIGGLCRSIESGHAVVELLVLESIKQSNK